MASANRWHATKIVLGMCVLIAVGFPAHEAHAYRRTRMEIPECTEADLHVTQRRHKEAKAANKKCDAILKAEKLKPDTPRPGKPPPQRVAKPQPEQRRKRGPSLFDRLGKEIAHQQEQDRRRRDEQRIRQQYEHEAKLRARTQEVDRRRRAAEQQRRADELYARQRAASQQAQRPQPAPAPAAPAPAPVPAAPPSASNGVCFDAIQNKIPWDRAGRTTQWSPSNVAKLCAGAEDSIAPGQCFAAAMREDPNRQWPEAIKMCAGKR